MADAKNKKNKNKNKEIVIQSQNKHNKKKSNSLFMRKHDLNELLSIFTSYFLLFLCRKGTIIYDHDRPVNENKLNQSCS